jgi:hypothetical protein
MDYLFGIQLLHVFLNKYIEPIEKAFTAQGFRKSNEYTPPKMSDDVSQEDLAANDTANADENDLDRDDDLLTEDKFKDDSEVENDDDEPMDEYGVLKNKKKDPKKD